MNTGDTGSFETWERREDSNMEEWWPYKLE